MRDFYIFLIVIVSFVLWSNLFWNVMYSNNFTFPFYPPTPQEVQSIPPLTKENVLREIIKADIKEPLIVYKQVLKETGHLKCIGCSLDYNNLFGFTVQNFLKFDNWVESIEYYKQWQQRYDGGDYYEFLKEYWGAPDMDGYCETLKTIRI